MASTARRSDGRYQIVDEPRPGALARFAMNPMIPIIVFMIFGSFWYVLSPGGLLFILNSLALGGPTRAREIAFACLAVLAKDAGGAALAIGWPRTPDLAPVLPYLEVIPLAVGLWLAYQVFLLQSRSHHIREHLARRRGEK
ncbi:MAG: hypothetical protein GC150_06110 [Rhizobiales bacterium]|nr:hypothetical protein [Hyphomicrobiales bacterium]